MKKSTFLIALATVLSIGHVVAQTSEFCNDMDTSITGVDQYTIPVMVTATGIIGAGASDTKLASVAINIQSDLAEGLELFLEPPSGNLGARLADANGGVDGLQTAKDFVFSDDISGTDYPDVADFLDEASFEPIFNSIEGNDGFEITLAGEAISGTWNLIIENTSGDPGTVFEVCLNFSNAVLGTEESFASRMVLFPNPASSTLNLTETIQNYTIYNILGNKVLEGTGQAIDISSLSEGVYMAELTNDGNKTVEKFVVKK